MLMRPRPSFYCRVALGSQSQELHGEELSSLGRENASVQYAKRKEGGETKNHQLLMGSAFVMVDQMPTERGKYIMFQFYKCFYF